MAESSDNNSDALAEEIDRMNQPSSKGKFFHDPDINIPMPYKPKTSIGMLDSLPPMVSKT